MMFFKYRNKTGNVTVTIQDIKLTNVGIVPLLIKCTPNVCEHRNLLVIFQLAFAWDYTCRIIVLSNAVCSIPIIHG